jgi:hypothetical protein
MQAESSIMDIMDLQEDFWDRISAYLENANPEIAALKEKYQDNQQYAEFLLPLLIAKNIPAELSDSTIMIGPMDIAIRVEEHYLQISLGRKKQVLSNLEPNIVVKYIENTYKKLNSSFSANSFFKRLLRAYDFANTRMYFSKEVKYGYSVALKDVFELFTLSPAASDYKIENFLWDIGRLCAAPDIENYRFELGYSRDVHKMYIIKTANGETLKASTLTIHKED